MAPSLPLNSSRDSYLSHRVLLFFVIVVLGAVLVACDADLCLRVTWVL